MKKKIIVFLLIAIVLFINNKEQFNNNSNKYQIKTYIDGKLAMELPKSSDGVKFKKALCTNGTATFDSSSWRLEVKDLTKDAICTIEFENSTEKNFNEFLKGKQCTAEEIKTDEGAKDCLVNENGYRYEGSDPNNYVMFNNELWRVIGVFNTTLSDGLTKQDLVKLIRYEPISGLAWNANMKNTWNDSPLKSKLNNEYLNSQDSLCNIGKEITRNCKFSAIGIKQGAKEKIENVTWNLKGYNKYTCDITVDVMYNNERLLNGLIPEGGSATGTGKVGLMYASDYGYAVLANSCNRTINLNSYSKQECGGNNWLYKDGNTYTLAPLAGSSNVTGIGFDGSLAQTSSHVSFDILPTIYLKSNVKYMSGTGTYFNPFIIN